MLDTNSAEKELYVEKLNKLTDAISSIKALGNSDIISYDVDEALSKYMKEAETVKRKISKNEFEIAIVGLEKAGKSSFCNALIEINILPTKDERCTYTSTKIEYSDKDEAVVVFYKEDEINDIFREKLLAMGIEDVEKYSYNKTSLSTYTGLFNSLDKIDQSRFESTINEDVKNIINNSRSLEQFIGKPNKTFEDDELLSPDFKGFIERPEKAIAVKEVRIGSSKLGQMKNAIIFDVPGFDSPTAMHKDQTLARMKNADAIIVIANGDRPSITKGVLDVFNDRDDDNIPLSEKLFVFANKIDKAATPSENIRITKDEWKKYKYISDEARIFAGSANAYLQSKGKNPTEEQDYVAAINKFKEQGQLPDGDGIDAIRNALENYNKEYRFVVLKQRADNLLNDLEELFKPLYDKYKDNEQSQPQFEQIANISSELNKMFSSTLSSRLNELKVEIIEKMNADKPISAEIEQYIESNITQEVYAIQDNEITRTHNDLAGISNSKEYEKVESKLREMRFHSMYGDFSASVMEFAQKYHKKYDDEIKEIILKCLKEAAGCKTICLELQDSLSNELESVNSLVSDGYYQSLIERFARDIYEILIKNVFSENRYDKFKDEMDNFFSLSIFYDKNNKQEYLNVPAKDLPFCKLLLFHNESIDMNDIGKKQQNIEAISNAISKNLKKAISSELTSEISKSILKVDIPRIIKYLDDNVKSGMADSQVLSIYKDGVKKSPKIDLASSDFKKIYTDYHAEKNKNSTLEGYEQFKEEFNDDIDVLQDVLSNAFIKAINIEKPFIAKETKNIEDIIEHDFSRFINKNLTIIKRAEVDEIKSYAERIQSRKECLNQISKILDTIKR